MIEIERKFLVRSKKYRQAATEKLEIAQGFLNTDPERTVRIRVAGKKAWLTVKGKSEDSGLSRFEWETEVPVADARVLLKMCEGNLIEKVRYIVPFKEHVFEIDEFSGSNQGLILAEVELETKTQKIHKPDWLGQEVTGQKEYYNSQLATKPYNLW